MYHLEGILSRALDGNRTYAQLNISWYSVSRRALQNDVLSINNPYGIINVEITSSDIGRVGNGFSGIIFILIYLHLIYLVVHFFIFAN